MIRRIKKANALILTTVILFAVSTIAAGITMYFYHASLLAKNTNVYFQKRVDLENEFNKNYLKVIDTESTDELRSYFLYHSEASKAFLDGEYYSTIKYLGEVDGKDKFTYEIETTSNRRECHLIKTIYEVGSTFSVDPQEVYYVTVNN